MNKGSGIHGITGNGGDDVRQGNNEGFSLVELLVAMVITVFVMSGIVTLLSYGTRSMNDTQARAALQDQAKDAVNHISTSVLEGTEINLDEEGRTRGALLIGKREKKVNETLGVIEESYNWYLYWVAGNVEAGGSDLLCFIRLEDLEDETSSELSLNFDTKSAKDRFAELAPLLQSLEAAKKQKGHLLCDDVESFECTTKDDMGGGSIERNFLHIALELKDERSDFMCEKDITMRNQ